MTRHEKIIYYNKKQSGFDEKNGEIFVFVEKLIQKERVVKYAKYKKKYFNIF